MRFQIVDSPLLVDGVSTLCAAELFIDQLKCVYRTFWTPNVAMMHWIEKVKWQPIPRYCSNQLAWMDFTAVKHMNDSAKVRKVLQVVSRPTGSTLIDDLA